MNISRSLRVGFPEITLYLSSTIKNGKVYPKWLQSSKAKTFIDFFEKILKNITWLNVGGKMGQIYENGNTDGILALLINDQVDLFSYPVFYTPRNSEFTNYTITPASETGTAIMSYVSPSEFNKKTEILSTLDNLPTIIWVLQLFVALSVFLAITLLRKLRSINYGLLARVFALNLFHLYFNHKNLMEAIILTIYNLEIFLLRTIFSSLIKTEMVVVDASKFIDTVDQIEKSKYTPFTWDSTSFAIYYMNNNDTYQGLRNRLKIILSIGDADKVTSDISYGKYKITQLVALLPSLHLGDLLITYCTIGEKFNLRVWLGETIHKRLEYLWYNKALSKSLTDRFEYLALKMLSTGFSLRFWKEITLNGENSCILERKLDIVDDKIRFLSTSSLLSTLYIYILFVAFNIILFISKIIIVKKNYNSKIITPL